uniref:EGF-like domain-containing protein n=1 Tax=Panagrolaimus davidi TaxID=227884 RepID=A0A914P6W7_9BILA
MNLSRTLLILFVTVFFSLIFADTTHHHHGHRKLRRHVCLNGRELTDGKCQCNYNYTGENCERAMHCLGKSRSSNGSCIDCKEHYYGEYCDLLNCTNGIQDEYYQKCICDKPYSGDFCDQLVTADVYLFYNSKMMGPFGALTIIPLLLIYYGCESKAQKRQVKRIGDMMSDQNVNVDSEAVKNLLDD